MNNPGPVRLVSGEDWLARIARFRVDVWQSYGILAEGYYIDGRCLEEQDQEAIHLVILAGDRLCGAVRYNDYAQLADCPLASSYRAAGIELSGPIAIPERMVVDPEFARQGIWAELSDRLLQLCVERKARYMISECSELVARAMRKRGRQSLGMAPIDPRFPGARFEWMLTDIEALRRSS